MSIELLQKSIALVEEDDGLESERRKGKRKRRAVLADREKRRLSALADVADIDFESGEVVEVASNKNGRTHLRRALHSSSKPGASLVEQFRLKPKKDILKRNIRYMKFTEERQLDAAKTGRLLELISARDNERRRLVKELDSQCNGLREPKVFKKKEEKGESVFTDDDFMKIGPNRLKVAQRRQRQQRNVEQEARVDEDRNADMFI